MILRVAIANITPRELAQDIQDAGLNATVFQSWGAGSRGVEEGATAEFVIDPLDQPADLAFPPEDGRHSKLHSHIHQFVTFTLRRLHEEAAYLTLDGRLAFLMYVGKNVTTEQGPVYSWQPVRIEVL